MNKLATTKMSSKGQVVIPEEIRNRLGLKTGVKFVVLGERDVIILKAAAAPSMAEFNDLISKARKQVRKTGLKRSDVDEARKRVRGKR